MWGLKESLMKFYLTPSVFGYAESTSPEVEATEIAKIFRLSTSSVIATLCHLLLKEKADKIDIRC